jgi:chemotaxis family two-component system response regulator Rcp1
MGSDTMTAEFVILLVEDNPADVRLTEEALANGKIKHKMHVVRNGIEAMDFIQHQCPYKEAPRPDMILLDLNLPCKDGREVLEEIKTDPDLKSIPVIILTSSEAEEDIIKTYDLHANGYIVKPVDMDQFFKVIREIKEFWMSIVLLPAHEKLRPLQTNGDKALLSANDK